MAISHQQCFPPVAVCVCHGGRNRSRAIARALRRLGWRASYCGVRHDRALKFAADIADMVVAVDYPSAKINGAIAAAGIAPAKVFIAATGKDVWLRHDHPQLKDVAERLAAEADSHFWENKND